jgi:arylsulfatase A-like enzyme
MPRHQRGGSMPLTGRVTGGPDRAARALLALGLAGLVGFPPAAGGRASASVADPPNILVIMTDDQRAAGTLVPSVMPETLRWFADRGTAFRPAFGTTPICCPGRATVFTGQYAHNHGVRHNDGPRGPAALDHGDTVQRYLDDAGYRTALFGKFFNPWTSETPPHFDVWSIGGGYYDATFYERGVPRTLGTYATRYLAGRSVRFIEQSSQEDDPPWLLYVTPSAPHTPATPERRYEDAPVPPFRSNPAVEERNLADKPPHIGQQVRSPEKVQEIRRAQLRTLMSVDDMVGQIMRALVRVGEIDNTLAIFLSDNGFLWGEHNWRRKSVPYRPGVAIPLLMRWPGGGVPHGDVDTRWAANVDIAATILDAAGVPPGHTLDGRSLLQPWTRGRILLEYWGPPLEVLPDWHSTLQPDVQYVEYLDQDGDVTFEEYYDLREDPWELRNLLAPDGNQKDDPDPEALAAVRDVVAGDFGCRGTTGPGGCP